MSAGAVVALIGAAALVFVSSVVAFRGWPGLGETPSYEQVVLQPPAARPDAPPAAVVLGSHKTPGPAAHVARTPPAGAPSTARQAAPAPRAHVRAPKHRPAVVAAPAKAPPVGAPEPAPPVVVETAPVQEAVPPADRAGLAGAADDVVATLDKIIP